MNRAVKPSLFHKNLIETIDDLLEMSRKFREATDPEEKKIFSRRFTAMSFAADVCMSKYDVKKLKFTRFDDKGKRRNAR